jgi:hypothetical protein
MVQRFEMVRAVMQHLNFVVPIQQTLIELGLLMEQKNY